MTLQPEQISFSMPAWIQAFVGDVAHITDVEGRAQFVIEASKKNVTEKTGGPFAAAVFESDTGKLVSLGVNLVTNQGLSLLHAEIVAIALAQAKLGTYDLGHDDMPKHEIVSSTEPCAMCFGAIPWSGVKRVVTSATDADARSIGFDEGPKVDNWCGVLEERGINVITEVHRAEAIKTLQSYFETGGEIYNSRGNGAL